MSSVTSTTTPPKTRWSPRRIAILAIGLVVAIQLYPTWLSQTNPTVVREPAWDSPETRALAKRACFDCHSNETVWPAYSRVAPFSWLITRHVVEGRGELNFSEWGPNQHGDSLEEMAEHAVREIKRGEMPLSSYLPLHPEAKLTEAEKAQLIKGLEASLR